MQGTAIEAMLWGDFADKHHDTLEEGKVRRPKLFDRCQYTDLLGLICGINVTLADTRNDSLVERCVHSSHSATPQQLKLALSPLDCQVYYISRGKVKPANKAFAAVRNDYTINLDNGYYPV